MTNDRNDAWSVSSTRSEFAPWRGCESEEARAALMSGADITRTARELSIRQLTLRYADVCRPPQQVATIVVLKY